jgi:2-oxoacid:acceptor oxidoreductase delta subunit (pyruvate/2-ketoisovalerate family)
MSSERLKGWKELPRGGAILEPGCYEKVNTGTWRTYVPVVDTSQCTQCLRCWILCPDSAVPTENGKRLPTDLVHCKGCGICAEICPVHCITLKLESEMKPGEPKG